jgi:hypothetical protein
MTVARAGSWAHLVAGKLAMPSINQIEPLSAWVPNPSPEVDEISQYVVN